MKNFFEEFKAFALKGNVMDLTVGVIIGAAFGGVVASLTENILSPIIGLFTGRNFDGLELRFSGVSLKYGAFITSVINFVIMALVVFLLVKAMNKLTSPAGKSQETAAVVEAPRRKCPYCMTEVHDDATRCPACTSHLEQTH